jgi:hypothetical protein
MTSSEEINFMNQFLGFSASLLPDRLRNPPSSPFDKGGQNEFSSLKKRGQGRFRQA